MSPRHRRGERGSTIIEVMVATTILIIAGVGFAGTSQYAAGSTGTAHRRTAITLLRAGVIDRLHVTPRATLRAVSAAAEGAWIVDGCFDLTSQRLPGGENAGWAADFACPQGTVYRSWISVIDNGDDAWASTTGAWSVSTYVERVEPGCSPSDRQASVACASAELLLTD